MKTLYRLSANTHNTNTEVIWDHEKLYLYDLYKYLSSAGTERATTNATGVNGSLLGKASTSTFQTRSRYMWLYLEPILSNADGDLGIKFRKVDQGFRQVARIIESDPRLSTLLQSTRAQTMLDTISEQLNACQSALNEYIDEKRSIFPRFYFLSDDDLLELLGQARAGAEGRATVMQSHLKKLFPGITGVHLGPGELSITALCSHFGETFQLEHPVDIDCSVEVWLKNLEQEIRSSLKNTALKCLVANSLRDQDPFSLPTQILCLGQNIRFTEETEKAIVSKELHKLKDNIEKENVYYAEAETEDECEKYKKQALILQCAYYVSVVQSLIENNVVTTSDWFWEKQLRFYLQNDADIVAKMGLAQISYSYEYLGVNTGQFVRTETTDESFLILTQSLHLGLVGNPFGPAGTGKTESVKALGSLFGRLVLVFNCDEAMDAQCMGRLLTGVARCGAWGCFDEFNRLPAAALAAAAHQLAALLAAARPSSRDHRADRTALLNGKRVPVSEWCGVAATMNPAARGYGGRRALPPALQHALRPLALRPPPRAVLAARLLAAHAALAAHPRLRVAALAHDLDAVFTLASTLLSGQRHYDWGLRALKAAVGSCGAALRALAPASQAPAQELGARAALRDVLRLNNLSKLTRHDAECFENILAMVFADVPEKEPTTDPVYLSLENTVKHLGLVHNKVQIQKCMELYEQLQQRMGVAIVGPPGSGKTTIRHMLKTALSQQGRHVAEYVVCPKAMSRRELLGHVRPDTRQWTAGVLAAAALDVSHQPHDVWSWIVCDGDIDPEWVEALNSVLDDNRLLTLPSGERVHFGPNVNFVFETHSLDHASPATISRMGIILFSDENNCSQDILESWAQKKEFENDSATLAVPLLTETVKRCLKWLSAHKSDVTMKECNMSLVKQIIAQFEFIAQDMTSTIDLTSAEDMVWSAVQLSVMGLIKENAVDSFYEECGPSISFLRPQLEIPPSRGAGRAGSAGGAGEWSDALLRSARVRACESALRPAVQRGHHAVIIGPEASAKTLLAEYILKETNSTVITIDCTPHLEPKDIIEELKRSSAAGGGARGAGGAGVTLLLRALHRARSDAWGSAPVHCLLLQLVGEGGFWSLEEGGAQWRAARVRVLCTAERPPRAPRLAAALLAVPLPGRRARRASPPRCWPCRCRECARYLLTALSPLTGGLLRHVRVLCTAERPPRAPRLAAALLAVPLPGRRARRASPPRCWPCRCRECARYLLTALSPLTGGLLRHVRVLCTAERPPRAPRLAAALLAVPLPGRRARRASPPRCWPCRCRECARYLLTALSPLTGGLLRHVRVLCTAERPPRAPRLAAALLAVPLPGRLARRASPPRCWPCRCRECARYLLTALSPLTGGLLRHVRVLCTAERPPRAPRLAAALLAVPLPGRRARRASPPRCWPCRCRECARYLLTALSPLTGGLLRHVRVLCTAERPPRAPRLAAALLAVPLPGRRARRASPPRCWPCRCRECARYLLTALSPLTGGLLRHVRVLCTAERPPRAPRLAAALLAVPLPEADNEELLELLGSYLSENTKNITDADISSLSRNMLTLYKEVTETFNSKPHYKWNPSHLRQWCENIKWFSPCDLSQVVMAVNAVANMIFRNRLVTDDEKSQYNAISKNCFKTDDEVYFKPKLRSDGVYLDSVDYKDWHENTQKLINQCLTDDENCFGETGIEVCRELSVLCPVIALALNGGAATCAGAAGAGRRAAARLVACAAPAALVLLDQPALFHTTFKNALTSAGEGTRTLVVLCESVATGDALACVEAFLSARSMYALPSNVVPAFAPAQQTEQTFSNMKQNLGIVICLDVEQDNLAELLDSYPLLYNAGLLCWLARWADDTLAAAPARLAHRLTKENSLQMSEEDLKCIPVQGFVDIYKSLDNDRVRTPSRYIHFIKTFYKIFSTKKQTLLQRSNTLTAGVEALRRARSEVAALEAEAAEQEVELSDKQMKANQALDQIGATVRATTDKKEEMHQLKKNIEIENEKLQIQKKEIEEELATVEPVIAAARAAVGDIKPESLSEVRSLRAPPDAVRDVLEGVLRLMGIADTSWHSMKSFLSRRGVKEDIRCLDASQISAEAVQSVQRLLQRRGASFEEAAARRASAACAPLAAWVRANLAYALALARVRPLQERQRLLLGNLKRAEDELAALASGLATVDERVAALQEQLGRHTRAAAALELRLAAAARSLGAARALLARLAHEYDSWEADLQNISQEILELNQRSLLAAGYLTFLPDLTEPQARDYLSKWCSLINFEDTLFSVINFLSTPEKQLKWEADGLPLDQSAFKNALFIDQYLEGATALRPLLLDPEGAAEAWLRGALAPGADFVPQHAPRLATALACARRLGRTLVITEVERIEEWWWSAASAAGGRARVLLAARRPALRPAAPPHVRAALAPLHFGARLHALVDQLVHYAMQTQNPEMNEKLKEIKLTKATLQNRRHELQENLLRDLSGKADILHDEGLLAALESTRSSGATIAAALSEARELERSARAACAAYETSARRAAALALAARRQAALPPDTLLDEFAAAAARASPSNSNDINDEEIVNHFTRRIIERVLLSLHKKDKYIVVMHLLHQVYDTLIPEKLWQIFIGNSNIIEDTSVVNEIKKRFQWIDNACIMKVAQIRVQDENLFNKLSLDNSEMWMEFQKSGDLNLVSKLNLGPFESVVAVAALRPGSLYRAIVGFVDHVLGTGALGGGRAAERAARWAHAARPVLLLAAHAHDALAALARSHSRALSTVGAEEGRGAWEEALENCRGSGAWLALAVGASPFSRDLLSFVTSLAERPANDFNDEFRLWILAEDREIPSTLANTCVHVILESPEGVKRNACGTLSAWAGAREPAPLARLLAGLALFHALAQERRAYIPQGWSRWYEWEWGDVSASGAAARAARGGGAARELCGALYAARVDRAPDRAVLRALLARCLRDPAPAPFPASEQLQDYIAALETLPDIDTPELLALPANCRAAWENSAADSIVAGLRELNSTTNINTNDVTTPIKTFLSLWKKMMSGSPLIKADYHIEKPTRGWWGALCASELRDAAAAARALHAALARLAHAPRAPLHTASVPDEWQLLWSGPSTPEAYIKEFCHRARAAVDRIDTSEFSEDYMPEEVDLRQFLRPARVLCALRARAAVRRGCPLRALTLSAEWDCSVAEVTDGALLVRGLRLSGGEWRAGRAGRAGGAVCAVSGAAPPHAPAPPLLLRYVPEVAEGLAGEHAFEVPLYSSESREEQLGRVRAPLHAALAPRALLHALALSVAPTGDYC
ncbi:unnamed protein product [Euphydryas editha]|uniref:Dynein heavy chain, cytoplasmic n=1 Tax=Euphydryas editha TaxID=104508 RepID=A0AAU9TXH2_EUPED|nr:unnamed protein product [Euphydryas editha]